MLVRFATAAHAIQSFASFALALARHFEVLRFLASSRSYVGSLLNSLPCVLADAHCFACTGAGQ